MSVSYAAVQESKLSRDERVSLNMISLDLCNTGIYILFYLLELV